MTFTQAIILGAIQGVTEFLPISSSAHLILVPWLMNWPDQGLTFDVVVHAATLVAILSFFWRDWLKIIKQTLQPSLKFKTQGSLTGRRILLLISIGTIPAAISGFWLQELVSTNLRHPVVVSIMLFAVALLLWLAEKKSSLNKSLENLSVLDVLLIGIAQAVALVPGTSRSGITITLGLFRGMTREAAARFSFLLATPIILGAFLYKIYGIKSLDIPDGQAMAMLVSFSTALVVGYLTIKYFIRFLKEKTLYVFIYYRILLSVVILLVIYFGEFQP